MANSYHYAYDLKTTDPTIKDGPTELHIELGNPETGSSLVAGIDRSLVNALRRIILGEVRTRGFAKNILIPESYLDPSDNIQKGNLTIFNTEHLSDRVGMVPIHDYVVPLTILTASAASSISSDETPPGSKEAKKKPEMWVPPPSLLADQQNWVFRICDPNDPNLPLKHLDDGDTYNRQRYVRVQDIRVFKRNALSKADVEGTKETEGSASATASVTGPVTVAASAASAASATTVITHSRDKIAQVSSKINYIFLKPGEFIEMGEDFKKQIFKYPGLILLSLKKGEGVFAEMTVETGYGGVIPPNAMLPEANSHARWISAIPDYRFKMEKEFSTDYHLEEQIANALKNFELDQQLAPILSDLKLDTITLKKVKEYQDNIDKSGFFRPGSDELAKEKADLDARVLQLEANIKKNKELSETMEKTRIDPKKSHDPVQDQQNYRRSKDTILGRYDNPERFMLEITYNGHLWPQDVWILAIGSLIEKIRKFKYIINNIQDISGRIAERALVQFDHNITNKLSITIDDKVDIESHTLGNLIKCHYIYLLDHIIEELYPNDYVLVWQQCFSDYHVPHPLKPEVVMTFKTPGDDFPLFPGSGKYLNLEHSPERSDEDEDEDVDDKLPGSKKSRKSKKGKEMEKEKTKGPFSNLYDTETNETLRLLKITCDQLLSRLSSLLDDAKLAAATKAKTAQDRETET